MNSHRFGVATVYPLDILSPRLGYGFNKLKTGFSGNVVRLQKMTSNTQQDFGLSGESLDQSAVNSWRSGEDVRVVTYYDQTGNARHGTLVGAASTGDALVLSNAWQALNGKVAGLRNVGQYLASSWGTPSSSVGGAYYVGSISGTSMFSSAVVSGSGSYESLSQSGSGGVANSSSASHRKNGSSIGTNITRGTLYTSLGLNSAFIYSINNFAFNGYAKYYLGGRPTNLEWKGLFQAAIMWDADISGSLSNIDSSLNSYFAHY